jgi:hypothetical protein
VSGAAQAPKESISVLGLSNFFRTSLGAKFCVPYNQILVTEGGSPGSIPIRHLGLSNFFRTSLGAKFCVPYNQILVTEGGSPGSIPIRLLGLSKFFFGQA